MDQDASRLYEDGKVALLQGDLSRAEEFLTRCVKLKPDQADCHRTLGVYYAQRDEVQRSLSHYKQYLALRPDAPDASTVRKIIRQAEAGAGER